MLIPEIETMENNIKEEEERLKEGEK